MAGFTNEVRCVWLPQVPREMQLLESIGFEDPNGRFWYVEEGQIVDGASIPRFLWAVVGCPFVGMYRRATVFHDVYCKIKTYPHAEVHRMFYDAMIADQVSGIRAQVMYDAVKWFGPKW